MKKFLHHKTFFSLTVLAMLLSACQSTHFGTTTPPNPYRSTTEILNAAPESDWYLLSQDNLIYMTLDNGKQVVIELNDKFSPKHGEQIRLLANERYWDGLSVYRVQDNYVAQFGSFDIKTEKATRPRPPTAQKLPAEFSLDVNQVKFSYTLPDTDAYSDKLGFVDGFPVAVKDNQAFVVHCYGMVGAARENAPDSSQGNELYVMIGQPARNLDRQIGIVGRVVHGIEHLSSLPRGTGVMGFYGDNDNPPMGIKSVRVGSSLPASEQLTFKALDTSSKTFHDFVEARRHLQGAWFATKTSGGMGICDVRQTIQQVK